MRKAWWQAKSMSEIPIGGECQVLDIPRGRDGGWVQACGLSRLGYKQGLAGGGCEQAQYSGGAGCLVLLGGKGDDLVTLPHHVHEVHVHHTGARRAVQLTQRGDGGRSLRQTRIWYKDIC